MQAGVAVVLVIAGGLVGHFGRGHDVVARLVESGQPSEAAMNFGKYCFLVLPHQAGIAHHVRAEDCGQLALGALGRHGEIPPDCAIKCVKDST